MMKGPDGVDAKRLLHKYAMTILRHLRAAASAPKNVNFATLQWNLLFLVEENFYLFKEFLLFIN